MKNLLKRTIFENVSERKILLTPIKKWFKLCITLKKQDFPD